MRSALTGQIPILAGLFLVACMKEHPLRAGSSVEATAAQAMLKRISGTPVRVMVDSNYAVPRTAPASIAAGARPARQHEQLVGEIGATPRNLDTACTACSRAHPQVLLLLSNPAHSADTAEVTVTAFIRPGAMGASMDYETVHFTLRRLNGKWAVMREIQLGVS